ncbi:MAG TPA: hypothetical protein P5119_06050 [Candidatus Aminicenantes bacterium]|nr:hypothetical protein [Candidatus Aminicenantes bacterium]HRY64887.1 hypothetical protein [Candidatus Aminicenantes bacterium]HRZ71800.1 hypothetical protein [Candidatus Aminicenantes bacterium]
MGTVERCRCCVLPAGLPGADLDGTGVCGLCRGYRARQQEPRLGRKREFEALVEHARRLGRAYDCLVPLSGGKDSTYALYLCDRVYKLKCLAVTFDNGYLSEGALANVRNAVRSTRADHIMYQVNPGVMRDLYKLFLAKTGSFCPACLRGIGLAAGVAERFDIPLTVAGTGWQVSYLAGLPELYQEGTVGYFRNVVRGEPVERDAGALVQAEPAWSVARVGKILSRLLRIPRLSSRHYVRLYDHFDPDYETILRLIRTEMGWSSEGGAKTEHLDCRIHDVAGYVQQLKFPDLTPETIHRAGLVRMGKLEREAALAEEARGLEGRTAPGALAPFCEELGLTVEEFRGLAQDWRKLARFREKKGRWKSLYHRLTKQ